MITDMTPEQFKAHLDAKFNQRLDEAEERRQEDIRRQIAEAVAAEREACAKIADDLFEQVKYGNADANDIADAIRARGNE